jgi:hypothetical protein
MFCELMTDAYKDLVLQEFARQIQAIDFDTHIDLFLGYQWTDEYGNPHEPAYDEIDCGYTVVTGYADPEEARRVCRQLHVDAIIDDMRSRIFSAPVGWQATHFNGRPTRVRLARFFLVIGQGSA